MKTYYNGYSLSNTRFSETDIAIQTTQEDWQLRYLYKTNN